MKKLISIFVLFVVFIANSNAQEANDQRFTKQESNRISVSNSSVSNDVGESKINNTSFLVNKEDKAKNLEQKQVVSKNNDVLKVATSVKTNRVEGIPASLTNQPLKRYDEDLIPVKVN